jgi:hypothetical protein
LSSSFGALLAYGCISVLFFARSLFSNLAAYHLGLGKDPSFLMWALVWWPYALRNRINPFLCKIVWSPDGFNLAWSGGIPLPSIVASPVTATAGPIATYNSLCLISLALAAWSAFILCREFAQWWAAFIAGYLFGFSSYMLGQLIGGHLNLMLVFPAPLMVWSALRALDGRLSRSGFAILIAALFVAQFLCSIELAASLMIFAAIALLLGWFLGDDTLRQRLRSLQGPLAGSAAIALVLLSPYLFYLFQSGTPQGSINSPAAFSADLVNLIIPTRTVEFGGSGWVQSIAGRFPGNLGERDAYFGLPLLFVVLQYGWAWRREFASRFLLIMFAIILLFALGPRLRLAGLIGFGLPWKLATHVPMLKSALPARFMNYAFLVAVIVLARWLVNRRTRFWIRVVAAALILGSTMPNLDSQSWIASTDIPEFFAHKPNAEYFHRDENVLAIPYGIRGDSMLWQAVSGMAFHMAGGYTGMTPRTYEQWPIVNALMTATYIPDATRQLLALMAAKGATVVLVDDAHQRFWDSLLSPIDPTPQHSGGVWLYRPAPVELARYTGLTPLQLQRSNAQTRFDALIAAARAYLKTGGSLAALTPRRAQQLGLLPPYWVGDPDVRTNNGLYLGPWKDGQVAIGVVGSYEALAPLVGQYRGSASGIYFPFPKPLRDGPSGDTFMRLLVMTFAPARL